eukprot:161856_1
MAAYANNSSNSKLILLVQSNVSDIDEHEFELTDNEDWGGDIEEIDSYNYKTQLPHTQVQRSSQNKTSSNKWVCIHCNHSNKRIFAIKNNYRCIKCNHELIINDTNKNKEHTTSESVLPNDIFSSDQQKQLYNLTKFTNMQHWYRPSLCTGIYGSFVTTNEFWPSICEFPQAEIQTNMTKLKKISVDCKIDKINDLNENKYFIKFENGTAIEINKELNVLLSLSNDDHSDFGR